MWLKPFILFKSIYSSSDSDTGIHMPSIGTFDQYTKPALHKAAILSKQALVCGILKRLFADKRTILSLKCVIWQYLC